MKREYYVAMKVQLTSQGGVNPNDQEWAQAYLEAIIGDRLELYHDKLIELQVKPADSESPAWLQQLVVGARKRKPSRKRRAA
jgi:hypothetical protein